MKIKIDVEFRSVPECQEDSTKSHDFGLWTNFEKFCLLLVVLQSHGAKQLYLRDSLPATTTTTITITDNEEDEGNYFMAEDQTTCCLSSRYIFFLFVLYTNKCVFLFRIKTTCNYPHLLITPTTRRGKCAEQLEKRLKKGGNGAQVTFDRYLGPSNFFFHLFVLFITNQLF
jgi:hypothetical protein